MSHGRCLPASRARGRFHTPPTQGLRRPRPRPAAAVHAGVIKDADGGLVLVRLLPGEPRYAASLSNGVQSAEFGEYAFSIGFFDVPAKPVGTTTSAGKVQGAGTGTGTGTGSGTNTGTRTGSGTVRFARPLANGLPLDW